MNLDKNALLYYQAARALKLPVRVVPSIAGIEIKLGNQRYFIRQGDTPFNSASSKGVAENKYCMNRLLKTAGLPVPEADAIHISVFKNEKLDSLLANLTFPLVVKPTLSTVCGQDVLCNITDINQLQLYMSKCYQKYDYLTVEEFHSNLNSYRVLVFYNKVIGVVQRFSARVIGDGVHSIRELIAISNIEREQLKATVSLGPIKVDAEYNIRLKELNMTLDTIPEDNKTIVLCYTCNSTRGGTMASLGKKIAKQNADLCCRAARVLGLNLVGFDVCCEDILIPFEKSRGVIIEANYNPDLSIHENPMHGIQNCVSRKILQRLILRHPLAYIAGLYQNRQWGFYLRCLVLSFACLSFKWLVM